MAPYLRACSLGLLLIVWWLVVAADPPTPPTPSRSPGSSPTATPRPGQIFLSPVAGAGGTTLTVNGSDFSPTQQVVLYWDLPSRILKTGTAGPDGAFRIDVTAPSDPDGAHLVCVQAPVAPCATFTVEAKPVSSPTPSLTPSPTVSPTATAAPSPSPSPSRSAGPAGAAGSGGGGDSALSILLRPPFVIFPILVLLAAVGLVAYLIWLGRTAEPSPTRVTLDRRPQAAPPAPTVFHPPAGENPAAAPPGPPNPENPRPPRSPRPPNYPTDAPPDLPQAGD